MIWLRVGNRRTETIFDCLRNCLAAIVEFGADESESVLLILLAGTMQKSLTTDGTDRTDSRRLLGKVNAECSPTNW